MELAGGHNVESSAWKTADEIRFVDGLGTFSGAPLSREVWLQRYREAINHRRNWGDVSMSYVSIHVEKLLADLRSGLA